ncbi:DUF3761 domain-containing protein [Mycobacterium bourgelatii]|nr:DUF3761 domain-containing protein [Mycobacterium bourgelatii]
MRIRRLFAMAAIAGGALGVAPAALFLTDSAIVSASCSGGYYENSSGQCIPRPSQGGAGTPDAGSGIVGGGAPSGATAICRDGDYSFSTHHSGTCSGHGGVRQWLTN